jgi:hypothetical protein
MNITLISTVLLTFLLGGSPRTHQDVNREFLLQVLQAHVGTTVVTDIEATSNRTGSDGRRRTTKYLLQGSKNMRVEHGEGSEQSVSVHTDTEAWQTRQGKVVSIPEHAASPRNRLFPFLDLIAEFRNPNLEIVSKGMTSIDARETYHVQLRLKDTKPNRIFGIALDEEVDFYIDAQTLLIVRSERFLRSIDDMTFRVPLVSEFSDYRRVNGVAVPFRIVTITGNRSIGMYQSAIQMERVIINPGISPMLFVRGQ